MRDDDKILLFVAVWFIILGLYLIGQGLWTLALVILHARSHLPQ